MSNYVVFWPYLMQVKVFLDECLSSGGKVTLIV